jgi:hypothetical protein
MDTQNQPELFQEFQFLGIFLGGIVPILIFWGFAVATGIQGLKVDRSGTGKILVLTFVLVVLFGVLYKCLAKHGNKPWFGWLFSLQAIICFLLIHFLILFTGGSKYSVFAFTCLYVPSVVGYVYGKAGWNLRGAVVIMLLIYSYNLFWGAELSSPPPPPETMFDFTKSLFGWTETPLRMDWIHFLLFLLQVVVLWVIAAQKEGLTCPPLANNTTVAPPITDSSQG